MTDLVSLVDPAVALAGSRARPLPDALRSMPVRPVGTTRGPEPNASLVGRADLTSSVARFVIRPDNDGPALAAAGRVLAGRGVAAAAVISEHYWIDPGSATVNRD